MPSVAASFGLDAENPLGLAPNRDVVVLLIDGLGAELLARHRDLAPTLNAHVDTTLRCGFPATTATSLTSLGVGASCAEHGITGYSFAMPGAGGLRLLNSLRWRLDSANGPDARGSYAPEVVQQNTTRLQDLAAHGVEMYYVIPAYQRDSALTAAAFRAAGTLHPAAHLDEVRTGILDAHVVSREQAVDERWFGPTPPSAVIANRIGDLIAVGEGGTVLVLPGREPLEARLLGHHGAWSADEQLVPLIASR